MRGAVNFSNRIMCLRVTAEVAVRFRRYGELGNAS